MYAFVDRPVRDLDGGAHLLVWAMRRWVHAVGERQCPGTALAPAFARLTALGALPPFMAMMALLNRHGLEKLSFCAPGCARVSEHEALILATLGTLAGGWPERAEATLAMLVAEPAVAPLLDAMVRLGVGLETALNRPA